ncbi:TetR/AcrR family transcriptional regulator [Micromonospora sp. DR5-3]|uniref:TetR/AcrR family transcriptional regulator n=1 Tax=unclassified Micromonospora TaxID=2617518 RepID=UPI001CA37B9D|nr:MULTISPECIES: TetR/AcrR family transcriptional regulator [unclassified Micromonospora]MCW3819872.1 TetR/AcrR family transcriptional regulator [Micromonospora sp. DR5-3]
MVAAGELFARRGREAQMEEIAARAGLGMGTLYRHFPNKQALLTAMVGERFHGMAELARAAEQITDAGDAFETILRNYLEAADGDASFQLALMGSDDLEWERIRQQKAEFAAAVTRIIDRAVASGRVRADLTLADFTLVASGVISTMYFKPGGNADWRRHLQLALDGIRKPGTKGRPQRSGN